MTYTFPEIADPLTTEEQLAAYHHLLGTLLGHHPKISASEAISSRIHLAGTNHAAFQRVTHQQVFYACGVVHGLQSQSGTHKDGSPIVQGDIEKSHGWLRAAIEDVLELVPAEIREEAMSNPAVALESTHPLKVIDGISDPDNKAKELLNRVYAVLWSEDLGGERYPAPESGLRPTLKQRLERHARDVPGLNQATLIESLDTLMERAKAGTLGKSSAGTVAKLLDPCRQVLLHFDRRGSASQSGGGAVPAEEEKSAPSRSFERVALIAAGVVILFLVIDRFLGSETRAGSGDLVVSKIDNAARADAARENLARTTAEVDAQAYLGLVDEGLAKADAMEKEIERWQRDVLSLRRSDAGRRFAVEDANVQAYASYLKKSSSWKGGEFAAAARARLKTLKGAAESSLVDGVTPTQEMRFRAAKEVEDLEAAAASYAEARKQITRLVGMAGQQSGDGPTLEARLSELENRSASKARDDLAKLERELEEDRKRRVAEAKKKVFNSQTDALVQAEEEKVLLARAKALESRYPMFFTKGLYAFQGYPGTGGEDTRFQFKRLPSLADLDKLGVTTDRRTFNAAVLGKHMNYGTMFDTNDRGGFWPEPSSEEEVKALHDAFDEFRELKAYFVKAGLLRQ